MILPDVNLLLYAYDAEASLHRHARDWWEKLLSSATPVAIPWVVALGFVRISTHPRHQNPLHVDEAVDHVRSWLDQPQVFWLQPGERHAEILFALLTAVGTAGNLTTDAHLAALAIEHRAELHSTDSDFARFDNLRWRNPLKA